MAGPTKRKPWWKSRAFWGVIGVALHQQLPAIATDPKNVQHYLPVVLAGLAAEGFRYTPPAPAAGR